MSASLFSCASEISRVELYAEGAIVTRSVTLPTSIPQGTSILEIEGITPLAEPGSFRIETSGGCVITSTDSKLVFAPEMTPQSTLISDRETLQNTIHWLQTEQAHLLRQREVLAEVQPSMGLRGRRRSTDVLGRVQDVVAVANLVKVLSEEADTALLKLAHELKINTRRLATLDLERLQRPGPEQAEQAPPTRTLRVHLEAENSRPDTLSFSYEVRAARWWPAYTVRLSEQGQRAEIRMEAFIAQATFEDWSDVEISLITASLTRDIQLPELRALRLGRPRPPKRSGFREPPEGLNLLFDAYDDALNTMPSKTKKAIPSLPPPKMAPVPIQHRTLAAPEGAQELGDDEAFAPFSIDDEFGASAALSFDMDAMPMQSKSKRGMIGGMASLAMAPVAAAAAGMSRGRKSHEHSKKRAQTRISPKTESLTRAGGWDPGNVPTGDTTAALQVGISLDGWGDFNLLVMAEAKSERRGQLVSRRETLPLDSRLQGALDRLLSMDDPLGTTAPADQGGQFDHRYDALGQVEVPSDGRTHRTPICNANAPAKSLFTTTPLAQDEVFREVELTNPFHFPMLAGPADVFVDGALVITSKIQSTDRGGKLRIGLGVEERLRVARNVRMTEDRRGLLGGKTTLSHEVSIEIASGLQQRTKVEVIDRLPITYEKEVEIELLGATPKSETYDQEERGEPVKGGLRWVVEVTPGEKSEIFFRYQIKLPTKLELQGGNHRA